jgi:hypothetical protein
MGLIGILFDQFFKGLKKMTTSPMNVGVNIKINEPRNNATFPITDRITFRGTARGEIVRIELWAENRWHFGSSNVTDGKWLVSYGFTQPGQRQINVRGLDTANNQVASETIFLTIQPSPLSCNPRTKLFEIAGHSAWKLSEQTAFFYKSGMSVDADGAPNAYNKSDTGIDFLANAGRPGNWWALVTDNGRRDGNPVIQGSSDPFPGYYISTTALVDGNFPAKDPRRYVDATKIPYIVLPHNSLIGNTGVKKGDFAVVYYEKTQQLSFAIFADVGPRNELGEGSVKLAQNLGHDPFVNGRVSRGISEDVFYLVFPGSGNGRPRTIGDIEALTQPLFEQWGGRQRLEICFQTI